MIFKYLIKQYKVRFSKERTLYVDLKNILGSYPNNIAYYQQAFTHRSALRMHPVDGYLLHNERLEYLGDALLGAIVAEYLYKHFPECNEGVLTQMRSKLVSRASLSQVAMHHKLEKHLIAQINIQCEGKYIFSNMVEAFIGAIYLDKGYLFTQKFVIDFLLKDFINPDLAVLELDFKSRVLEWSQKRKHRVEFVTSEAIDEQTRSRFFKSQILVNKKDSGQGRGRTKKEAEQDAARLVWEKMTEQTK